MRLTLNEIKIELLDHGSLQKFITEITIKIKFSNNKTFGRKDTTFNKSEVKVTQKKKENVLYFRFSKTSPFFNYNLPFVHSCLHILNCYCLYLCKINVIYSFEFAFYTPKITTESKPAKL